MHGFFLIQKLVTVWIFSWVAWQHPQIAVRKVPTSQHYFRENGSDVVLPFLKASSFLQHLLDSYPWLLLGGLKPGDASQQLLTTFWKTYRPEHPSHEVYRREAAGEIKFGTTIPLLLHGDGARTLKNSRLKSSVFSQGLVWTPCTKTSIAVATPLPATLGLIYVILYHWSWTLKTIATWPISCSPPFHPRSTRTSQACSAPFLRPFPVTWDVFARRGLW